MSGSIAVHGTHEAADKLGGIGTVLQGLLPEPAYLAQFPRNLLVGVYPFPAVDSVVDDPAVRAAKGWTVKFDSASGKRPVAALAKALTQVAEQCGVRLVYGERAIARNVSVPVLLASPQGIRREVVTAFRQGVRDRLGFDLEPFEDYPAVTDGVDRRLERLLGTGQRPDEPERLVVDAHGRPFPGGAAWSEGRAVFPPVPALDAFAGYGRANKYLLELQYHTFVAPALWAATACVLHDWAPDGDSYDPAAVTLFCHDWLGVPLFWALTAAGQQVAQTVYFAHEARIFRLLAEGALHDRAALLRAVCHPEGYDAALYPHLAQALAKGWDLATMFPGTVGFPDIFHHQMNHQAVHFDRVVAVGPLVQDETRVLLRPAAREVALCPNGIPAAVVTADQAWDAHERLADVAERHGGVRPRVIFTGVMRCELSKAPWRNVGLWRTFVERYPTVPAAFFWLSAPRPRPTRAQATRWAQDYRWPLDHRAGEGYDLRPEEDGLWQSIARLNRDFDGRATMYYINQFGWSADVLGALDPGAATFGDLRCGADVEVGLSIYEPFGIAPLEPFAAGATCLLSDSCGCARHLESLGLADQVLLGAFSRHHFSPREVDARRLQRIEQAAYDGLVTALGERLGLSEPRLDAGPWRQRRATRIAAAQQAVKRLSWAAAVEHGLLPALT